MVTLTIDDVKVTVPKGTTIMAAAETQLGIKIPRLCYHPDLSMQGSCRVCIVEVKGVPFYMASCSVNVWEGMEVQTNSPAIRQARRDNDDVLVRRLPVHLSLRQRAPSSASYVTMVNRVRSLSRMRWAMTSWRSGRQVVQRSTNAFAAARSPAR